MEGVNCPAGKADDLDCVNYGIVEDPSTHFNAKLNGFLYALGGLLLIFVSLWFCFKLMKAGRCLVERGRRYANMMFSNGEIVAVDSGKSEETEETTDQGTPTTQGSKEPLADSSGTTDSATASLKSLNENPRSSESEAHTSVMIADTVADTVDAERSDISDLPSLVDEPQAPGGNKEPEDNPASHSIPDTNEDPTGENNVEETAEGNVSDGWVKVGAEDIPTSEMDESNKETGSPEQDVEDQEAKLDPAPNVAQPRTPVVRTLEVFKDLVPDVPETESSVGHVDQGGASVNPKDVSAKYTGKN